MEPEEETPATIPEEEFSWVAIKMNFFFQYIRKLCEIQKLRQAREAMNEIFPLTPAMWQEFARDEASISTGYLSFPFCSGF